MPSRSSDPPPRTAAAAALSDPELRRILETLVRRKVPSAEADDLVQSTLADALAAPRIPEDPTEFRRWVFGIVRNKIADYYRLGRREIPHEPPALDEPAAETEPGTAEPHSARDLLRWAQEALPENDAAQQTFDWMLREGQGEKLEAIAEEAQLPAPQVRKRVSRLRQHLKRKWVLELSAVAALGLALWFGARALRPRHPVEVGPDRIAAPSNKERASALREAAMAACSAQDFKTCVDLLDRAKAVDAAGDDDQTIREARAMAVEAIRQELPAAVPAGQTHGPSNALPVPDAKHASDPRSEANPPIAAPANAKRSPVTTGPSPKAPAPDSVKPRSTVKPQKAVPPNSVDKMKELDTMQGSSPVQGPGDRKKSVPNAAPVRK